MNTIRQEWDNYFRAINLERAPQIQIQETRRAFYAGTAAMLSLMIRASDDAISIEVGASMAETWDEEIKAFYDAIGTEHEGK